MSVAVIQTYEDAYVDEGIPSTPNSPNNWLNAGLLTANAPIQQSVGVCRSWLKFNLNSIPAGSTINSATISIHAFWVADNYISETFNIERETQATWDQGSITWNNAPNATVESTLDYAAIPVTFDSQLPDKADYVVAGMGPMVRRAFAAAGKILSIRINDSDETSTAGVSITSLQYGSGSSTFGSYYPMYLTVNYTPPIPPPPPPPPPPASIPNRGAGHGRGEFQFKDIGIDRLEKYRQIGEEIAKKRELPKEQSNSPAIKIKDKPRERVKSPFTPKPIKISDVPQLKSELQKLKFAVVEEISLQQEEDEAIFMLMMLAI